MKYYKLFENGKIVAVTPEDSLDKIILLFEKGITLTKVEITAEEFSNFIQEWDEEYSHLKDVS